MKPVQITNVAAMQGLAVISEKELALVVTPGAGFGTALLMEVQLLPQLELAKHPFT